MAAGYEQLLNYRREHIGNVEAGNAFITPGFNLKAKYIIHAVSPKFIDGNSGEEELLHSCYRKSLDIAAALDPSDENYERKSSNMLILY